MYVLWFEFIYPWFKFYFQFISNLLSYITIPPKERKVKLGLKVKLGYNICIIPYTLCCLDNLLMSGLKFFICAFLD